MGDSTLTTYTVVGIWHFSSSEPVVAGVFEGEQHTVDHVDDGRWCTFVEAPSPVEAEALAVQNLMRGDDDEEL